MAADSVAPDSQLPPGVTLEDGPCPMGCPRDDEPVLVGRDRLHDLPGRFPVVRCRGCGLMRTNPRPTAASIGHYYPADYLPYLEAASPAEKPARRRSLSMRLSKALLRSLGGHPRGSELPGAAPGRLLEIGCASGAFLAKAASAGWTVSGIEFSAEAARRAREAGFEVQDAMIEDVPAPAQPYDVIAGWMVFEHLHRPEATFRRLREWVREDGWLALSVPDAGSLQFRLFGARWYDLHLPAHMTHFTAGTLPMLLQRCGWRVERRFWKHNPNNFLQSLRYWALDRGHARLASLLLGMIRGERLRGLHRWLGVLLSITRQSGRMVVWARPDTAARN